MYNLGICLYFFIEPLLYEMNVIAFIKYLLPSYLHTNIVSASINLTDITFVFYLCGKPQQF